MERKKIRKIGGVGGVSDVPHDLAVEVLKKLPAKSLMRFKCVSKLWRSTIDDRRFSNDHRALSCSRTSVLLIYPNRDSDRHINYLHLFNTAFLGHKSGPVLNHHFTVSLLEYTRFTEVINGLFCLYGDDRLSLCNISTHEIMDLPPIRCSNYFFGFEPIAKEYKASLNIRFLLAMINRLSRPEVHVELAAMTANKSHWVPIG
ncbi:unnamed protein product [Ilex paraguariensis]|uniref:F-box domain-containing protein n=1 Tax=Ilex paraguariensis TaxID=185542 RepID=A0ABC8QKU3_9AQUA